MKLEAFDAARATVSRLGLTSALQTKIALFVGAAKNANALFLGRAQTLPLDPVVRQFLDRQYFQECEAALALAKAVRWDADPALYFRGSAISMPLWTEAWRALGPWGAPFDPRQFYSGIALGHGLLAEVRLAPILPADLQPAAAPLAVLLHRIEQDNARGLQTNLTLLKMACAEIPIDERERIVERQGEVVRGAFAGFLAWITEARGASVRI